MCCTTTQRVRSCKQSGETHFAPQRLFTLRLQNRLYTLIHNQANGPGQAGKPHNFGPWAEPPSLRAKLARPRAELSWVDLDLVQFPPAHTSRSTLFVLLPSSAKAKAFGYQMRPSSSPHSTFSHPSCDMNSSQIFNRMQHISTSQLDPRVPLGYGVTHVVRGRIQGVTQCIA